MEERAIHISSINREKRGTSRPGDFTIKFNPSLKLDPDKKHHLVKLLQTMRALAGRGVVLQV